MGAREVWALMKSNVPGFDQNEFIALGFIGIDSYVFLEFERFLRAEENQIAVEIINPVRAAK